MSRKTIAVCVVVAGLGAGLALAQNTPPDQRNPSNPPTQGTTSQGTTRGPSTTVTVTEQNFVPVMIQNHQQEIELARIEEERGSSPAVKSLATRIRQSHERGLADLRTQQQRGTGTGTPETNPGSTGTSGYGSSGSSSSGTGSTNPHSSGSGTTGSYGSSGGTGTEGTTGQYGTGQYGTMGRTTQDSIRRMQSASGREVDRIFLQEAIRMHQQTIDSLNRASFQSSDVKRQSQQMISEMKQHLNELKSVAKDQNISVSTGS